MLHEFFYLWLRLLCAVRAHTNTRSRMSKPKTLFKLEELKTWKDEEDLESEDEEAEPLSEDERIYQCILSNLMNKRVELSVSSKIMAEIIGDPKIDEDNEGMPISVASMVVCAYRPELYPLLVTGLKKMSTGKGKKGSQGSVSFSLTWKDKERDFYMELHEIEKQVTPKKQKQMVSLTICYLEDR